MPMLRDPKIGIHTRFNGSLDEILSLMFFPARGAPTIDLENTLKTIV